MVQPTNRRHRGPALLAAAALVVTQLAGFPTTALAASEDDRLDLPRVPVTPLLRAASGAAVIADVQPESGSLLRVTTDNGATWTDLDAPDFDRGSVGYAGAGAVVYYRPYAGEAADSAELRRYDFATSQTSAMVRLPVGEPDAVGLDTVVYHSSTAGETGYFAQAVTGGEPVRLNPGDAAAAEPSVHLDRGALALFETGSGTSSGSLSLVPLDGGVTQAGASVTRLRAAALRGEQVVYSRLLGKRVKLCFRDRGAWSAPRCWTVPGLRAARVSDATFNLSVTPDWVLLSVVSEDGVAVGDYVAFGAGGGRPVKVRSRSGTSVLAVGDSPRPLANVGAPATGYVGEVLPDGRLQRRFANPTAPVAVAGLALGASQLVSLDNRSGDSLFQVAVRPVTGGRLGDEILLQRPAQAAGASAGRVLLDTAGSLLALDATGTVETPLPKYGADATSLSGPYHLSRTVAYDEVTRADGQVLRRGAFKAVFGDLVLRLANATRNRYDVLDVTSGNAYPVAVPDWLSPRTISCQGLWGDYVFAVKPATAKAAATAVVIDYRADRAWSQAGVPIAWGDGYAVLSQDAGGDSGEHFSVWNFRAGTTTELPDVDLRAVATDGVGRLAYATARELVLRQLDGVGQAEPRLLGVVAEATINPAAGRTLHLRLDATKPLASGSAEILDTGGAVVRQLAFGPAADASVRDLSWDGLDASGQPVPLGRYTWRVQVAGADGSGALVTAAGGTAVGGGVRVVGSLTRVKPKVSDTTPRVGQRLVAVAGAWAPAGVKLSYRWYRVSASGKLHRVGKSATYRVRAADSGKRLRVKVTGVLDGYDTASKWSTRTAKVQRRG